MNKPLSVVAALIAAGIVALASLVSAVGAQSPVGGALATLAAATAQADQWQANQRAVQATRAAVAFQTTQSAAATRQAFEVQATQSAQAELDRQRAATATAESINAAATRQAIDAAQSAQATRQAVDLEATQAAYDVQLVEIKRRSDFGTWLLYLAGILAIGGCAFVVWRLVSPIGAHTITPDTTKPVTPVADGIIIDVIPLELPALPKPNSRMGGGFAVIDDREFLARLREHLAKNAKRSDPQCPQN